MRTSSVKNTTLQKYEQGHLNECIDLLVVEEPLEIRINYGTKSNRQQISLSITMRTPGNDFELTQGFLFSEGIINNQSDIKSIRYCEQIKSEEEKNNIVNCRLKPRS